MTLEVAGGIRVVDIGRVNSEVHEEVHDQETVILVSRLLIHPIHLASIVSQR